MGQKLSRRDIGRANCIIVVPAYNEERSLGKVLSGIVNSGFRCVVVDDGSTDRTCDVARQYPVDLLRLPVNLGVGGALRLGFSFAVANGYEAAIQFDADGQHDHSAIEELLREANSGHADLVIGSRFRSPQSTFEVSSWRLAAIKVLAVIATRYAGTSITDSTSGFRLVRRPLLAQFARHLPTHYLGDTFEALVLAARSNYRVTEIPTMMSERQFGSSSASRIEAVTLIVRAVLTVVLGLSRPFAKNPQIAE